MTDDRQTHRMTDRQMTDDRQIVNKHVHPFQTGAIVPLGIKLKKQQSSD